MSSPQTIYYSVGAAFFTLTNPTASPVALDSVTVTFGTGDYWARVWFVSLNPQEYSCSFFYAPPGLPSSTCQPDVNIGAGGSVVGVVGYDPCSICRGPASARDTLKVYAGGSTIPATLILDDSRYVAGEAAPDDATLRLTVQPSLARSTTRVTLDAPDAVRIVVLDALGRRVVVLADGVRTLNAVLDVSAWAPGVYHVVADGVRQRTVGRLTVSR